MFCFAATSRCEISAGATAQPSRSPGKNVFDVVPACTTTSGARLQRVGGEAPSPNAELAVGDVLDDQEAVLPRELDEERTTVGGERHAGRVLVIRDRVEELRPQAVGEPSLERVDVEAGFVDRYGRRSPTRSHGTP